MPRLNWVNTTVRWLVRNFVPFRSIPSLPPLSYAINRAFLFYSLPPSFIFCLFRPGHCFFLLSFFLLRSHLCLDYPATSETYSIFTFSIHKACTRRPVFLSFIASSESPPLFSPLPRNIRATVQRGRAIKSKWLTSLKVPIKTGRRITHRSWVGLWITLDLLTALFLSLAIIGISRIIPIIPLFVSDEKNIIHRPIVRVQRSCRTLLRVISWISV